MCSSKTGAQTEVAMCLPDSLLSAGEHKEAYMEFEYIIFNNTDIEVQNKALVGKAEALKRLGEYAKAQITLERFNYMFADDSLHFYVRMQTALCAYLASNFRDAESQLLQMDFYLNNEEYSIRSYLLRILVLNELQEYDKARETAETYCNYLISQELCDEEFKASILNLYSKKNIPRMKKVNKAVLLSTFVPGLGQLYAGYPLEAMLSSFFTLGSISLAGFAFYNKYWISGYFAGLGLFQKFYFGGQNRVEFLVEKKNYVKHKKFNERIKNSLIKLL